MADNALNQVDPAAGSTSVRAGDVPERLRRRYLTEERSGPGLGFYVDARVSIPAFRDHGRRLTTGRNDPQVIRDLVAIAEHRGWTTISVRGQTDFRRATWAAARAAGLEVRGYRPTERDLQEFSRQLEHPDDPRRQNRADRTASAQPPRRSPAVRLSIVEAVINDRIVEPAIRDRILTAARGRIADWLERGAPANRAGDPAPTFQNNPRRTRQR